MLLEVLCAGLLLAVAGVGLARTMAMQVRVTKDLAIQDAALEAQERVISAMSLLTRKELRSLEPATRVGEFRVRVNERERHLFEIAIEPLDGSGSSLTTLVAVP